MTTESDESLLRAWLAGDREAGEALVRRHHDAVLRFFLYKVGDELGPELTQETFFAVRRNLASFRGESSVRAWIFGIARKKLLKFLHKRAVDQQRFDPDASSVRDFALSPSRKLAARQQERLLLAALCRLPVDVQLMLELHYWEGMSIKEIASIVEQKPNTVKTRMKRGRASLDELMVELAKSPEELDVSLSGLEAWAQRLRNECEE